MEKTAEEHKKRLAILEKHMDGCFYETGQYHDSISDAMEEYANQKQPICANEDLYEIDNAIKHCLDVAEKESCSKSCATDHKQLADWLNQLKRYKNQKQPTPTDEEIERKAREFADRNETSIVRTSNRVGFMAGAKWLRDTYQPTEQQNEIDD